MAGFNEVFLSAPELKDMTGGQKMEVLDTVYEQMKQMPEPNREMLRNFRNQQMETMYEDMAQRGRTKAPSFDAWKEQMSAARVGEQTSLGDLMQGIQRADGITQEEKDLFERYKERDRKELLDDVANVLTSNPAHWVTGAQKMGLDLLGMASAGAASAMSVVTGAGSAGSAFSKGLKDWNDTDLLQTVANQQRELTKSDPALFNRLEGAAVDLAMGGAIGVGRRAAANTAIGRLRGMLGELPPSTLSPLQLEGLTALESAKIVAAPVMSNVVAGQLVYEGMERMESWLETHEVSEGTKAGLQAAGILLGGVLGGAGIEALVNKIARGETAVAQRVAKMGEWLEQYRATMERPLPMLSERAVGTAETPSSVQMEASQGLAGPAVEGPAAVQKQTTLADIIRSDPNRFSQEFMDLARDAEVELGPNFNPLQVADDLDVLTGAEAKLRAGEGLAVEEAEVLQKAGAGPRKAYPFSVQELEEIVPPRLTSAEREGLENLVETKSTAGTESVFEQTAVKELEQAPRDLAEREVVRPQMTQKQGVRRGLETARELEKVGEVEKAGQLRAALAEAVVEEKPKAVVSEIDSLRAQYRELNGKLSELREMWKENDTPAFRQYVEEQAKGIKEQLADIQRRGEKLAGAKTAPKVEFQESLVRPVETKASKEGKPKSEKILSILQEKAAIKAERKDVQTLMEQLTSEQRMDIEVLTDGLVKGREYSLGRALSEEERLDVMASVYNQKKLWDGRAFDESDSIYVENVQTGERGISAGYIEGKYPQLAKLMALNEPQSMTTQMFAPGNLLGTMSSLISRSGPATDAAGWQKVRPVIQEAVEAWDEVKDALNVARSGNDKMLREALSENATALGLKPEQGKQIADSILEAFPELNVALRFDSGTLNGAAGLADSLVKLVTVGGDNVSIGTLNHELGHVHFNYGLDASEKMQWLDGMRRVANSEELWKLAFPSYEAKIAGMREQYLADIGEVGQDVAMQNLMKADFAINSPLELYAEQWSNYLTSSILPDYNTLQSFGKLQKGWKKVYQNAKSDFNKMNEETREFFLKMNARPDVSEAKLVSKAEIDEAMRENPFYSADPLAAADRINEIDALMQEKYGQRVVDPATLDRATVENYDIATGIAGHNSVVQEIPFNSLPVAERIRMVSPEDALLIVEKDALSLIHQGANEEVAAEMQLAMRKVNTFLDPRTRDELIDRLTQERVKRETGDLGTDTDGMVIDPMMGNLYTRADIAQMRIDERASEYNRLDKAARKEVDKAKFFAAKNYMKKKMEVVKRMIDEGHKDVAKYFADPSRANNLDRAISKFLEDSKDYKNRASSAFIKEQLEEHNRVVEPISLEEFKAQDALRIELEGLAREEFDRGGRWGAEDSARSGVIQDLAAMDVRAGLMQQLMEGAKAKTDYITLIDGQYNTKLWQADQMAAAWARPQKSGLDSISLLSLGARTGYVGMAGLEYDPDGIYVPGLGHVTWSPSKFLESPLNVVMFPGAIKAGSKLGKLGGKFAQTSYKKALSSLPTEMAEKVESLRQKTYDAFVSAVHPTAGIGEDVADMLSQGKMAAAKLQKDFRGFAEVIAENFDAKDRTRMWKVLDRHPRWEQLEQAISVHKPDLWHEIQFARAMMDKARGEFEKLGLVSDKMPHSSAGNWLSAYVDDTLTKRKGARIAVLEKSNMDNVKANFLGGNKVSWTLNNSKRNDQLGANKYFREACARDGIVPEVGDRVNEYRERRDLNGNLVGRRFYAIEGTPTDKNFAKVYEKEHCWTEHREGYTIASLDEKSGPIKLERNFTVAEKKMAGQSFDISTNLAYTAERMGRDLRNAHIFNLVHASDHCIAQDKLTDNPTGMPGSAKGEKADWQVARDNAELFNQHWAYVPEDVNRYGMLKYGKLAGTYIDRDTFNAIRWMDGFSVPKLLQGTYFENIVAAHQSVLRAWKMSRTVFSPVAHMNNFVSNLFTGTMMGHNVLEEFRIGHQCVQFRKDEMLARKLLAEGKAKEANDIYTRLSSNPLYKEYNEIKEAQMADSTMWATEMRSSEFFDAYLKELTGVGKEKTVLDKIVDKGKGIKERAARAYENGDLRFKMGAFVVARRKGATPSEALRYAYESYFDYSTLSPGAAFLRDTGIFPFVSYMYKAVPAIARGLKEHPGRFATTLMALEAFHLGNINMAYGDGEALKHSESMEATNPEYMGAKGLFGTARTRPFIGTDDKGNPRFLDISRMFFGGDFGETSQAPMMDGVDFAKFAPGNLLWSLLCQSPVISYLTELGTGINPVTKMATIRGGTQLNDPTVEGRKNDAMWRKLWNMWAPNLPFLPYTYSNQAVVEGLMAQGIPVWPNIYDATGFDDRGGAQPLGSALAASIGIKIRKNDLSRVPARIKAITGQEDLEKAEMNKFVASKRYTKEAKEARVQSVKELLGRTGQAKAQIARGAGDLIKAFNAKKTRTGGTSLPN